MICGIKFRFWSKTIIADLEKLGVTIIDKSYHDSAELYKYEAEYRSLKFEIFANNWVNVSGSLHKYFKDENWSDFTFAELCECIKDLAQKFNFIPSNVRVHSLEFGVNMRTQFNPFDFCHSVIAHKNEVFGKFQSKGVHIGFECERQRYTVKIYDKGNQYYKDENILRFEIKARKMLYIERTGITVLSDLTDINRLNVLGEMLNETFAELIVRESVNRTQLSAKEWQTYQECINPKAWEKFTRNQRCKKKKQFNDIIREHGKEKWSEATARMIAEKWQMLSVMKPKQGTF